MMSMMKLAMRNADDDEHEDALQQEVVVVADSLEDQVTETGVRECHLGDHSPAHDDAELQRQSGELGQHRVCGTRTCAQAGSARRAPSEVDGCSQTRARRMMRFLIPIAQPPRRRRGTR